jgi:DNA primase
MSENRYDLHNWERKEIYVKLKEFQIGQRVSQTITSIRLKLIDNLINNIATDIQNGNDDGIASEEQKIDYQNYTDLKKILSQRNDLVIKQFH